MEQLAKTTTEIHFYMNIICSLHIHIMEKSENYWKERNLYFKRKEYFFYCFCYLWSKAVRALKKSVYLQVLF